MKKLITLFMASALVMAASAPASAIDVKVDGKYQFAYQAGEGDFLGNNADAAHTRVRLGLTFTASENLSAYFQTESRWEWGGNDTSANGTAFDGAAVAVKMRQAYIDWTIPSTDVKVRMGRQSLSLPSFANWGYHMFDFIADGIVVDVPLNDKFSVTGFWMRPVRENGLDTEESKEYDLFGLVGTASFDALTVSPWVVYSNKDAVTAGANHNFSHPYAKAEILNMGFGFEWRPFDPFTLSFDGGWGRNSYEDAVDQEGWFVAAKAAYKLSFAEPHIFAWYTTGDDKYAEKNSGQYPVIYGDFGGNSSTFFDNTYGPCIGNGLHNAVFGGTWGVSLGLTGMSFIDKLTHDFTVTYFGGTNNAENGGYGKPISLLGSEDAYMTTEDRAVEFNLLSNYEIYKNLSTALELAYIVESFDTNPEYERQEYRNVWRATLHFCYQF